jgi:hypothetical protein
MVTVQVLVVEFAWMMNAEVWLPTVAMRVLLLPKVALGSLTQVAIEKSAFVLTGARAVCAEPVPVARAFPKMPVPVVAGALNVTGFSHPDESAYVPVAVSNRYHVHAPMVVPE